MAEIVRLFWWLPGEGADPLPRDLAMGAVGLLLAMAAAGLISWRTGRAVPTFR